MKTLLVLLATCATTAALADQKLADKKNCLACHAIGEKMVGPALKAVAAKYAGQPDAAAMLVTKIQKGGSGVWGDIAMPPNDVTAAEAKKLAEWVLSLK